MSANWSKYGAAIIHMPVRSLIEDAQ